MAYAITVCTPAGAQKNGCYHQILEELYHLKSATLRDFIIIRTFFFAMCAAIALFVHGFILMTYRSRSKMVAVDQILEELCPLNRKNFTVFHTFSAMCAAIYCIETFYMACISMTYRSSL
jgi:hypothetical protein